MPELPEVETVVNFLKSKILNLKIIDSLIFKNKFLKNCSPEELKKNVLNQKIQNIKRKGKNILFFLSNDFVISIHLRMEGRLFYKESFSESEKKHSLFIFFFENSYQLNYFDVRGFATLFLYKNDNFLFSKELSKIAYDPLEKEFTFDFFKKSLLKCKNSSIKTVLLKQDIVSGIGNIYANEILFLSRLHPLEKVKNISDEEILKIMSFSKEVFLKSIKNNGTTIISFAFDNDKQGNFQNFLKVHGRKNKKCFECNSDILKIFVNQRGTYFCNLCQKIKE